ncbi:MAG: response regulator, partial [Bacteroidota bacterium]
MSAIKILIVDDHHLIAQAWTTVLQEQETFEVVGTAAGERDAIALAKSYRPEVILMDI